MHKELNFNGVRISRTPEQLTTDYYTIVFERLLSEIAMSRFTWKNLPVTINKRFLEYTLHYNGLAVYYYDSEYDKFLALSGNGSGSVNHYEEQTEFNVVGNQFLRKTLQANECVPIWCNYLRQPDAFITSIWARRLAEAERTVDINVMNERHPFIVSVDTDERSTLMQAYKQVKDGAPVIWGTRSLDPSQISSKIGVFNVGQDREATLNMMTVRARLWNDVMTLLGINNANTDKRERMITNEVESNNEQVESFRTAALTARQEACEQINRMYPGSNVQVIWNENVSVRADMFSLDGSENGEAEDTGDGLNG